IGQYGNIAAIKGCGFIYPISEERWASLNLEKTQGVISDIIHQQGQEIPFHVLFLKIPEDTYIDFNRKMKEQCSIFIDALYSKVLNQ
ncbi:5-methylcytosine restriction system specificity protein McrC, partial [Escherichia coli]